MGRTAKFHIDVDSGLEVIPGNLKADRKRPPYH